MTLRDGKYTDKSDGFTVLVVNGLPVSGGYGDDQQPVPEGGAGMIALALAAVVARDPSVFCPVATTVPPTAGIPDGRYTHAESGAWLDVKGGKAVNAGDAQGEAGHEPTPALQEFLVAHILPHLVNNPGYVRTNIPASKTVVPPDGTYSFPDGLSVIVRNGVGIGGNDPDRGPVPQPLTTHTATMLARLLPAIVADPRVTFTPAGVGEDKELADAIEEVRAVAEQVRKQAEQPSCDACGCELSVDELPDGLYRNRHFPDQTITVASGQPVGLSEACDTDASGQCSTLISQEHRAEWRRTLLTGVLKGTVAYEGKVAA